jgi:uncharacterized damage-inducible protein DinB
VISLAYTRTMEAYNRWMNERLYDCCSKLSDEERKRNVGAFFKSIHDTLNHLLVVKSLDEELNSDFHELRSERKATDGEISNWISSLSEGDLAGELSYMSVVNPKPRRIPLWVAVTHFFNHQTHHRGQLTTLLVQRGIDPGVTDLIWLPELQRESV